MSSRQTDEYHAEIADWKLERFLLGELPDDEMERIGQRVAADETLKQRLEALRESNEELLWDHPADQMARQIRARFERESQTAPERERRGWLERLGLSLPDLTPARILPVAAALATLLVLPFVLGPEREPMQGPGVVPGPSGERSKGDPTLFVFRKTVTGSEKLDDGAKAREGDLILVQYDARDARYGAIVSIDGRGTLTQHLPSTGYRSVELEQDGAISLPYSYELDDAPRVERFYFVTSDQPFEIDTIVRAAMSSNGNGTGIAPTDSLGLPNTLRQFTFTLNKDSL